MIRCLALVCLLAACHHPPREKPAPVAQQQKKTPKRAHEPMVYVDGAPRASLNRLELPPGTASGPLCDYLGKIGVDCASVRALHLYRDGGAVEPVAVLRDSRLEIDDAGRPRIGGAEATDVAVYVEKSPPPPPIQGIPYLDEPLRGGTRVNLDGRLAARMKRNQLDGSLPELSELDGEPLYALADFLKQQKLNAPRAVELVTADDGLVRVPDGELGGVSFSAERQRHGQMSFHFAGRTVSAVAVNLYSASLPPAHAAPAPADDGAPRSRPAGFSAGCDFAPGAVW